MKEENSIPALTKNQNYEKCDQISIVESNDIQSESSDERSSSIDSQDEIHQRIAFEIIEEEKLLQMRKVKKDKNEKEGGEAQENEEDQQDEQLDDDERQAFLYLHSVRKEKKVLLKEKKIRKAQVRKQESPQKERRVINQAIIPVQVKPISTSSYSISKPALLPSFKENVISNFNIVVQNVKYMIKSNQSYSYNNRKFNTKLYESIKLQNEPKIYELIKLTIGEIEEGIRKLSLELTLGTKQKKETPIFAVDKTSEQKVSNESPQQKQSQKEQRLNKYCLWIYSFLALHQGWSSYKHFQSLAEINFILTQKYQQLQKLTEQQRKSLLLLMILMVEVFEQRHLIKYMDLIIETGKK